MELTIIENSSFSSPQSRQLPIYASIKDELIFSERTFKKYLSVTYKIINNEDFNLKEQKIVIEALRHSYKYHHGQIRKDDSLYISHPFGVMKSLYSSGCRDAKTLAIALLHDCVEDNSEGIYRDAIKKLKNVDFDKANIEIAREYLNSIFGKVVTTDIFYLTKPKDKKLRAEFNEALKMATFRAKIVKVHDRIHNLGNGLYKKMNYPEKALAYLHETEIFVKDLLKDPPKSWRKVTEDTICKLDVAIKSARREYIVAFQGEFKVPTRRKLFKKLDITLTP